MINTDYLKAQAAQLGIELTEPMLKKFDLFAQLLIEKNKVMNLTAIREPDDIVIKHFVDSISLLTVIEPESGAKVLDVGTGAGFPGIPLLIVRPELELTMLDSTGKKLAFVNKAADALGLNAKTVNGRAEEFGKGEMRESFSLVCSRAVAAMNVLCEYCLPFVEVGGTFAAMKGAKADEELAASRTAVKTLGGSFLSKTPLNLADGAERNIILIKKISQTPPKYPRPSAQISKKPL